MAIDRAKHEAMLRRQFAQLPWPTSPHCIPEPTPAERDAFAEAFIRASRPPGVDPQGTLF